MTLLFYFSRPRALALTGTMLLIAYAANGANMSAQTAPLSIAASATGSVSADVPVRTLLKAMQTQDAAAIRAQFASTATQAYGADGKMKSAAATASWLESDIIKRKGNVASPEISVSGNEVVVKGQYNATGYSSKANFLFTVENGLITSWRMRY